MKDSSMKTLRRVLRYLKKRWHMLAASIVLAAASVAGTLYVPILVGNAIDCILGPGAVAHAQIMTLLSRVAAVAGITALLQWLMSDLNNRITFGVVRDVRRDGFRQLRNYVDMCALLAQRPDLKRFFDHAQTVLQRTDSLYYKLINNLVAQVNEDAICTAGINLGFDAIISCASNNRKQNGETRSWLNVGFCSAPELDDAIIQAEAGSSYAWVLYADEDLTPKTVAMLQSHTHSVFFVLFDAQKFDEATMERIARCNNVITLLCLHEPEITTEACRAANAMRSKQMFYGFLVEMGRADAAQAVNTDWLDVLAQYGLFCVYTRKPDMDQRTADAMYRQIVHSRIGSVAVPVLLLDWEHDIKYLNRMITPKTELGQCIPEGKTFPLNFD
mgnify:FL=1